MTVDHKSGFVAEGGGQVTNGYGTHSTGLLTGVSVTGNQIGVVGTGPTGVQGQGQGTGVRGQATDANGSGVNGQAADPTGTGVLGTASGIRAYGVQGVNGADGASPSGTGVQGQSTGGGVGVVGQSSGVAAVPYLGVVGQAQSGHPNQALDPYDPADPTFAADYLKTGVLGVGDRYGGVFQATPILASPETPAGDDQFANIQLTPLPFESFPKPRAEGGYVPAAKIPALPHQGQPGDIVAAQADDGDDNLGSVELWICIRAAVAGGSNAAWARIQFGTVVIP